MPIPLLLASHPDLQAERPRLVFANPERQAELGVPFAAAVENLLTINRVAADPEEYDRTGLMRGREFFRAGGGYAQPWTRDAAINSWNAGSLFAPDVARDTLWAVTRPDEQGRPVVQRDDQWWDKVVWIVSAWNHYRTTGDREFLTTAYEISERLLGEMEATRLSKRDGLFMGPSFFNDGITGYPAPPAEKDDSGSSFVLDHKGTDRIMPLSTNALYVGAYRAAEGMAKELKLPVARWRDSARRLRARIDRRFWMRDQGMYGYFLDPAGRLDRSQEGAGLSFAILFDVASRSRARTMLRRAHVHPYGIVDVHPHFARFSDERPGRHNAIVWPLVQGLWARAATKMRDAAVFEREMKALARLSAKSGGRFFEIYNATTGAVDGGWQNGHRWGSEPDQTWSATAYLAMVTDGLFGLRFATDGLRFEPLVPKGWGAATLDGVPYRGATLDLRLQPGMRRRRVLLNDRSVDRIPTTLTGRHTVRLETP